MDGSKRGATATRGHFDPFDQAIGMIERIEGLFIKQEIPVGHDHRRTCDDGEHEVAAHFHDPKGEMLAQLASAKQMVAEACHIAQTVMSEIP